MYGFSLAVQYMYACVSVCVWEGVSMVAQTVKNLPAMQETQV